MRKSLSFLLSGLLAFGIAFQTSAAPVQQRFRSGHGKVQPEVARTLAKGENRALTLAGTAKRLPQVNLSGISTPASAIVEQNSRAQRSATAAQRVSSSLQVFGTVIFNSEWTSYDNVGVYQIPVADGAPAIQFRTPLPLYSFFDGENKVYSMTEVTFSGWVMGYDLYVFNTDTKQNVGVIEFDDLPIRATDVAYDPTTGKVYGFFSGDYYGDIYQAWGCLDLQSRNVKLIANYDFSLRGVAIDKFGQAYGIDLSGNLYKIDKNTGETTLVGATGCPDLKFLSSAAYNDKDNTIILSFCNDSSQGLVEINPTTAASSIISTFPTGEEVIGLYIPLQAPDKAPATPVLEVACNEGSMTADFTITMPTALFVGTPLASDVEMGYKVYANGTEVLSGNAKAGATVKVSKEMAESGMTDFTAVATNADGESNMAKASCYIGKGTPEATSSVVLTYADGAFNLVWEPVVASADGGYIKEEDVKYDVVDAEGNVVASDLTATSWTKTQAKPEEITGYSFGVIAKYDAKSSKAKMSNTLYLGHYNAPLTVSLKDKTFFGQHSILDVNDDGKTWKYNSSKGAVYSYSNKNDADDWLISPAVYLEAGKAYDFAAVARAYSDKYPEVIEIKMGTAPTAEAMTTTLVEATTLGGTEITMTAPVAPATSGEYYIGFHAITEAGQWDIYLTEYSLSKPFGATAPDAATDLTVTPDMKGDLKAAIEFKTAKTTVTGAPYSGNMNVRVKRGDDVIKEMTVKAGTRLSISDNVPEAGRYTYTVECLNLDGEMGRFVSASAFVGPNVPNPPATVKAVENPDNLGEVTLSWEHATEDVDGRALYTGNLAYNVYLYDNNAKGWKLMTEQPISELSYTFRAQAPDAPQTFIQVGVQTVNRGVKGDYLQGAGFVPVGAAFKLPMAMSCVEDVQKYLLGIDNWDGCEFGMLADGDMNAVTSQDGDGQFFYGERVSSSTELGPSKGRGDLVFGKVDLAGAAHPVFSLYTWKITATDKTKLEIFVVCEGEQTLVKTIEYADDTHGLWTKKVVDLEAFAGKTIQLIIRYHSDGLVYCFFDNLKIMDMPDYDANAVSITAPKEVTAGEPFDVVATVENTGRLATGEFNVELIANGNVVATKAVANLEAGETAAVTFEQSISMAGEKSVEYTAHIAWTADLDPSNDTTPKSVTVKRIESLLPTVQNLAGEATEAGNVLTWNAIIEEELPFDPVVESFENAEAFSKEYDGWTFVDQDGAPSGFVGEIDVPNHVGNVDPESYMVIDGSHDCFALTEYAKEYVAASGKQYLGSIYAMDLSNPDVPMMEQSDDWAISPELKGVAQTVTFMGKNSSINYSELIQVWYSTENSVDPEDFVQLESFNNPGYTFRIVRTEGWEEYSFDLPEGARRFAIRCVSNDGLMFMLDDVKYVAKDATVGLELAGYNVYCNGVKLNNELVTTNTFTHADADTSKENVYHVTAVYNRGESEVSNSVALNQSGIEGVYTEALKVAVDGNDIVVTGAAEKDVRVVAADGKTLFVGRGDARVTVASGIYLVVVEKNTTKVIVR